MSDNYVTRPPIGFIVEGAGEYNTYPSLCSRIVNNNSLHIPCVNSGGYGGITSNLKEQLNDLVLIYHPFSIIITIDLIDVIKAQLFIDCTQLYSFLSNQSNEWLLESASNPRMHPLPEYIQTVIQIPKFESWMISDIISLKTANYLNSEVESVNDVDNTINDPHSWLKDNSISSLNPKDPVIAKNIISTINPDIMKTNSSSFDKFFREVEKHFNLWQNACSAQLN